MVAALAKASAAPSRTSREVFEARLYARGVPASEVREMWELAFAEGAARSSELTEIGRRARERWQAGAAATNRDRSARSAEARAEAISLAVVRLNGALPQEHRRWSIPLLALEVVFAWRDDAAPAARTVEAYLREGIIAGELPAFLIATPTTRGGPARRR
jgi:hypothetical protein